MYTRTIVQPRKIPSVSGKPPDRKQKIPLRQKHDEAHSKKRTAYFCHSFSQSTLILYLDEAENSPHMKAMHWTGLLFSSFASISLHAQAQVHIEGGSWLFIAPIYTWARGSLLSPYLRSDRSVADRTLAPNLCADPFLRSVCPIHTSQPCFSGGILQLQYHTGARLWCGRRRML